MRKIPGYRLHKARGLAVVTIDGRDHYLGEHGSPESRRKYDDLIAEWLAAGRALPTADKPMTVAQLCVAYWQANADSHLTRGERKGPWKRFRRAIRVLADQYGEVPAEEFSPRKLTAFRESTTKPSDGSPKGAGRWMANANVTAIIAVWRWGAEHEFVSGGCVEALRAVTPLRQGRSSARESKPVLPPDPGATERLLAVAREPIATLVRIQLLTGMRPGEACAIRLSEIDRSTSVWTYKPTHHKTEHKGKSRIIKIGQKGQEVLRPWIAKAEATGVPDCPLFRPTIGGGKAPDRKQRATPYRVHTYAKRLEQACKAAGIVPKINPNQFRHAAATAIRKEFDLETARAVLGHSSTSMTEIYAERDMGIAEKVAETIG